MIFLVILGFTLVAGAEIPGLIHKKYWWELIVFCGLLGIGFVLSMLLAMGVQLPPVTTFISQFIGNLLGIKPE